MNHKILYFGFLFFNLLTLSVFPFQKARLSSDEELLLQYKNEILDASKLVDISPRIIASAIFVNIN